MLKETLYGNNAWDFFGHILRAMTGLNLLCALAFVRIRGLEELLNAAAADDGDNDDVYHHHWQYH